MASNFVRVGARRLPASPGSARDFLRMKADFDKVFPHEPLEGNSIYRTRSEQISIFTSLYARNAWSPFGDYRRYDGSIWGRVAGSGPAASPDVGSNHTRGYAYDLNVDYGSTRFHWLTKNAHRYNFNWIEGRSVNEGWHWCWHVAIFPTASTPDPWEGRGAPDPVLSSDPGMSLDGSPAPATGSGGSFIETPVDPTILSKILENNMKLIYQPTDGPWKGRHYAIGDSSIKHIPTATSVKLYLDAHHTLGLKEIMVSDKSFRTILGVEGIPSNIINEKGYVFDARSTEQWAPGNSWVRGDDEAAKRTYRLLNK